MAKRKTMSVLTMSGVQYEVKDRDGRKASYVKSELEGRATKTVGSIAAGTDLTGKTVGEVLADILMGYVAPSALSIGTNLGTGVKEKGVSVTINKVTPTFTAGSKAITEFVVKEGDSSGNELYSGETVTSGTAVTLTTSVSGDGSSVWCILVTLEFLLEGGLQDVNYMAVHCLLGIGLHPAVDGGMDAQTVTIYIIVLAISFLVLIAPTI